MTRKARELEILLLTMYAALPLYVTYAIGKIPLLIFHAAMAAIAIRVWMGRGPEILPERVMRALGIAYIPLYFIDWIALSHSAIAASTHLVLFIAVYQPIEAMHKRNQAQRLLTASLIFVASVATSTHITIVLFVIGFAFLMFRQLMHVSHLETVHSLQRDPIEPPSGRAALFYVAGAFVIGSVLFPFLPRLRNPFVQGITGSLPGATTALSETIDFREPRVSPMDTTIIARMWMDYGTRPFFYPIRLRGNIYDRFTDGAWRQTNRGLRPLRLHDDGYFIARRGGIGRNAIVQIRPQQGKLFLPVGTYNVDGLTSLFEGPAPETYYTYNRGVLNFDVRMANGAEPLRLTRVSTSGYPVTPEVAALAKSVVGNESDPARRATLVERWMVRNFRYVPNPETPPAMTIERFLLRERVGHCEYFAAGMVVMLNALDVPARIAGGYYGGRLNPLTGYFTVRRDDAHAWTEVWDGKRWMTFDATPPSLRPGTESGGLVGAYATALSDSINYLWDRYVLTFGLGDQITLFADLLTALRNGFASLQQSLARAVRFSVWILVVAALVSLLYMRRRRPLFDLIAAHLRAHGVEVTAAMTVEEAMQELRARDPELASRLDPAIAMYEELTFSPRRDRERVRALRRMLSANAS